MEHEFDLVTDPEAAFRFLLVSRIRAEVGAGRPVTEAVHRVAAEIHVDFSGSRRTVGSRTLFRWLAAWEENGLAGLARKPRKKTESSTVLPAELLAFAAEEKKSDPQASLPEILRRARLLGVVADDVPIDRSTLYRALRRMKVTTRRRRTSGGREKRRFAWSNRMQLVLADGKHFRVGPKRLKRVAIFYLDDATRMGLDVVVGTSESTVLFLTGLCLVLRRYGKMTVIYLDGGPGFISEDTARVLGHLGIHLVIGTARYPEGHGGVERFNRTAKAGVLRHLDGRPDVDPDPGALTLRLRHWLRAVYNRSPHEFHDGGTPEERFLADERELRLPESDEDLDSKFFVTETRKVSGDHVVPLDGVDYETPVGHADTRVTLYRHVLRGTVHLLDEGRLVRLHPVDLEENAKNRRARKADECPPDTPTRGAADLAFTNDFGPVVDDDGGFTDPEEEETEEEEEE